MDDETARFLVSEEAREALVGLPGEVAGLSGDRLVAWFRDRFPPTKAAALSFQVELRRRAGDRIRPGQAWLLTSEGLEMMTHRIVAERRAARVAALGLPVADLTCGLGGDLAYLAQAALPAVGLERDPAVARFAAANVPGAMVVAGDAAAPPLRLDGWFVFADPSRRSSRGRAFNPADFSPAWDVLMQVVAGAPAGCVKGPPGLDHAVVPRGAEFEVVQLGRSLRESTVWIGGDAVPGLRRAVMLPAGVTLDSSEPECLPEPVAIGRHLIDPQSCVTRAGLVRHLGGRMGARLVDPHLGYLTADAVRVDPLAETFEVLEVVPFAAKRVREVLRARSWAPAEVRRRASPVDPEVFRASLGPLQGEPVTLFLTTIAGKRVVVAGRSIDQGYRQ